jgi:hypothetical protein
MTCSELETALKTATPEVYNLAAPAGLTEYVVWAVYGYTLIGGDDAVQVRIPRVQIDAYTQAEDAGDEGGLFARVMDVLDGLGLVYTVEDTGYDPDALAMRLIIQCDVA